MGYGANISEGAAIGIASQSGLVRQAALGMADQTGVPMRLPNLAALTGANMAGADGLAGASAMGGPAGAQPLQVTFAPVINVPGGEGVGNQVSQALNTSYAEFVKFMERFQHDQSRRSYGPPAGGRA